jgi:hypothetical protein
VDARLRVAILGCLHDCLDVTTWRGRAAAQASALTPQHEDA